MNEENPGRALGWLVDILLVFALAVGAWAVIMMMAARGAPAPKRKVPVRPALAGCFNFTWGAYHTGDVAYFGKDGTFNCRWSGGDYAGTWRLEGDTLRVKEWPMDAFWRPSGDGYNWSAKLRPGKLSGTLGEELAFGEDDFALEPLKLKERLYD